jgi:tripartite-type tricarboxylate transporter receptor subunit TctC
MNLSRRNVCLGGAGALLGLPTMAAAFPSRQVTLIVPSPPGGGLDPVARALAQELGSIWKQAVVVENRTGASGLIGTTAILNAPPDGHTLLLVNESIVVGNRFAFKKLPYDPDRSFTLLTCLVESEYYLVAHASVPATNLAELVKLPESVKKSFSYASWGQGSTPNLLFETMNQLAGTKFVGVPYRGVAPAMLAMISNEAQLGIATLGSGREHFKMGTLKPLAIMARKRSSEYPAVPTTLELGYPDLMASLWFGMVGPAGMPSALAASIVADIRMVLDNPDVVRRYSILQNYTITQGGTADFAERIKRDTTIFGNLARISKLEPQ